MAESVAEVVRTLGQVAEHWLTDPQKVVEAQTRIGSQFLNLWATTLKRAQGAPVDPVVKPEPKDSRFQDPEWSENPVFDFLKQAYLITTRWADEVCRGAEGLDEHTKQKARFYVKQISGALSPSNFLVTNPELIRETVKENGANLVRGMTMLAEDIEAGGGELKLRQPIRRASRSGSTWRTPPGRWCSATI